MADLLVVEDDPDAGEALVDILRAHGHDVRLAFDGAHGLKLLNERVPDVALLDVEMPILDGPGVVLGMLARNAGLERVPVVLLSGVPELRDVAARVGTPYFLRKPCPVSALTRMVDRALSERTPPTPPGAAPRPPR